MSKIVLDAVRRAQDAEHGRGVRQGFKAALWRGFFFGFGDELTGHVRAILNPEDPNAATAAKELERARYDYLYDTEPALAHIGEFLGAIPSSLGGVAALGRVGIHIARNIGKLGVLPGVAHVGSRIRQESRVGRVVAATLFGYAGGGIYGAGVGGEPEGMSRLESAGWGAGVGAGFGFGLRSATEIVRILPNVARFATRLVFPIPDRVHAQMAFREALRKDGVSETEVYRILADTHRLEELQGPALREVRETRLANSQSARDAVGGGEFIPGLPAPERAAQLERLRLENDGRAGIGGRPEVYLPGPAERSGALREALEDVPAMGTPREGPVPVSRLFDLRERLPNTSNLVYHAAHNPSQMPFAKQLLWNRNRGTRARISQALGEYLGADPDYFYSLDAISSSQYTASRPLYLKAFGSVENPTTMPLADIAELIVGDDTWIKQYRHVLDNDKRAMRSLRAERVADYALKHNVSRDEAERAVVVTAYPRISEDDLTLLKELGPPDSTDPVLRAQWQKRLRIAFGDKQISFAQLDHVKRAIDREINKAQSLINAGKGDPDYLKSLQDQRRALLTTVDTFGGNPAYANARAVYAGYERLLDAMEAGKRIFKTGTDADAIRYINTLFTQVYGQSEKDAMLTGVLHAVSERFDRGVDGANAVKNVFGTENRRKLLRAFFPNEKLFEEFETLMEIYANHVITHGSMGGTKTAPVLLGQQLFDPKRVTKGQAGDYIFRFFIDPTNQDALRDAIAGAVVDQGLVREVPRRLIGRSRNVLEQVMQTPVARFGQLVGEIPILEPGARVAGGVPSDIERREERRLYEYGQPPPAQQAAP